MDPLMCFCALHIALYCILAPLLLIYCIRICFRSMRNMTWIAYRAVTGCGSGYPGNGKEDAAEDNEPERDSGVLEVENVVDSSENEQILSGSGDGITSRRIEVPNAMVGLLIGKAGGTLHCLQYYSGAKIRISEITRDANADPAADTRPVKLIGTLKNVNKAEKMIKEVMAGFWLRADAGGSPALVPSGFTVSSGVTEKIQIQVPYKKAGLIIGKGGKRIRDLQKRSGALIQFLPLNLAGGDKPKERTLQFIGDKKHIDLAMELVKEVMNQNVKHSSPLSHYCLHGSPGAGNTPSVPYDNQQRHGEPILRSPPYGGYPSQGPQPGGNICFGSCWFAAGFCLPPQQ